MNNLLTFLFLSLTPLALLAEPQIDMSTTLYNGGKKVLFTIEQHDLESMQGCHYNLFVARKRSHLSTLPGKGLSIATFGRDTDHLEIMATHLRSLSRTKLGKSKVTLYFRMLMPCEDAAYESEIYSQVFKTRKRGSVGSSKKFMRRMKYHMRWAEDVPGYPDAF